MRSRTPRLLLCLTLAAGVCLGSQAEKLYQQGLRAERAGHAAEAYLLYSRAAALDPDNQLYWLRSEAIKTRATIEAKVQPKFSTDEAAPLDLPDEPHFDSVTERDLAEARKTLPPTELHAVAGSKDINLRGDSKSLFEQVARMFGLDVVFDGDYEPSKPIHFELQQADYRVALRALEAATGSFIVPLSPKLFLVAKDTQQKRTDVEPFVSVSIPVSEAGTKQDLTTLLTTVQQTLGLQKVALDTDKNLVVIRGPLSKVLPGRKLLEDLLYPQAQVDVELQFLEVTKSDMLRLGLDIPNSFPLYALTTFMNNKPSFASTLSGVLVFGGGKTMFGIGITDPTMIASMTNSGGNMLLKTDIRSEDGKAATIHIGNRYPIMTAGYFGPSSFQGPNAYLPPPSFTFEDLGLNMKVTPRVHGMDSVTLDLESEFKVLTGQELNGIPVIANRQLKSTVRIDLGKTAVIAGLLQDQEARTISGLAGLNRVPVLSALTSVRTKQTTSNYILILLRPKLLTLPPDQVITKEIWIGSENRPLTPL